LGKHSAAFGRSQIRSTKSEIRNKFKLAKLEIQLSESEKVLSIYQDKAPAAHPALSVPHKNLNRSEKALSIYQDKACSALTIFEQTSSGIGRPYTKQISK
jgi:hypothetical protein